MRKIIYIIPFIILFTSCFNNTEKKQQIEGNNLDTLSTSQNLTIIGKIDKGLLNNILKVYEYDTLRIIQKWRNGRLIHTDYYKDNKKIKHITSSYNLELIKFYDSIKVNTNCIFKENQTTYFNILNVPNDEITIAIAGGIINIKNDTFIVRPNRHKGDTLKIMYWYRNVRYKTEFEKYLIE